MKLKSIKFLKKKAWKLMSEFVRRTETECFTCGAKGDWKSAQAGHFVHKDSMDFNYFNIHRQCVFCNKWKHGNLGVYATRLNARYGQGTAERLIVEGKRVKKFGRGELEAIICDLQEKLKEV